MIPSNLPDDINAELLLAHLPEGACKVSFAGLHHRNAYSDIIGIEETADGVLHLSIGRNSLYNSLPEFMFHPIDRFNELPRLEEKERFAREYELQEQEKENAHRFFAPIDTFLLKMRLTARELLREYYETDKALIDILADSLTPEQRANRFIKQVLPMLPHCKHIRGDKTLLTLLIRKVLVDEGLSIEVHKQQREFTDPEPRYGHMVGATLDECYAGCTFDQPVLAFDIHYWSQERCDAQFLTFVDEMEQLRAFIQDYFMPVDGILSFIIATDDAPLVLNDDMHYNYLNFNTNV